MSMSINDMDLRPPDPVEWEGYEPPTESTSSGKGFILAPKGIYSLTPQEAPVAGRTKEGYLQYDLGRCVLTDPGQPWDGQAVNFNRINTKKWPNRQGSSILDYLASVGCDQRPSTNEEYDGVMQAYALRPFRARLDWDGYCNPRKGGCGASISGMEAFPTTDVGAKLSSFLCPTCKANGNDQRIFANLKIKAFLAPGA
jgi:hypothetical protein